MSVPPVLVGGRYRLIEVIAHGGMGVVWRARDERLDRSVAVKQLRMHPGITEREAEIARNRAIREAHITAQLNHPHAVPVLDAVEHEGQPCLVMPYLPSTPLSAVLRKRTMLPLHDVIRIGAQSASALAAAHRLRIVHRDVKPGNVLITRDGTAHISDFGISHAMGDATLTDTGFLHGTPAYLSPEVARGGSATFSSDVFSLGSTLYASLEGAPPFGSDPNPIALLHRVAAARVEPPTYAGDLGPLLLQMLSGESRDRPKMDVVAAALADLKARGAAAERTRPVPAPRGTAQPSSTGALTTWFPPAQDAPTGPVDEGVKEAAAASTPLSPAAGAAPSSTAPSPAPPSGATSAQADKQDHAGTRRRALVGLGSIAALVAGVLVLANVTSDPGQDTPGTAGDRVVLPTSSPATRDATTSSPAEGPAATADATSLTPTSEAVVAAPSPTPAPHPQVEPETEPSPEPAAEPSTQSTPELVTQAQPSPSTEQAPSTSQNRADELSSAVTDYYSLMPNNTDAAWPRMTADYQRNHAGGRSAFDSFWGKVSAVSVSDVQSDPPDRARATLTYSFSDGRTVVEQTTYRFVDDGDSLRIAKSDVLSSTTIG